MKKSLLKFKRKNVAQAMVEFALALPVLLLVVYGLLETGRLLFIYASVVTAARQAARYASASGDNGFGTNYYNDCNGIRAAANKVAFIQAFSNITIQWDTGPSTAENTYCSPSDPITAPHPQNGDRVGVTVSAVFTPIVPLVPFKPFTITSTSSRSLLINAFIAVTPNGQGFIGNGSALALGKSADTSTYTQLGQVIHYTYTLQNTGTTPIDGPFTITDNKIGSFQCGGAPATLPGPSSVITCNNPQSYTITMNDLTQAQVINDASAVNGDGTVVSNHASVSVSFVPSPHITLTKTGTPPTIIAAGQNITYNFTILNDGNVPLSPPFAISDGLIGGNWSCASPAPNPLTMGNSTTCTGTYAIKNADINNGSVTNTATATAQYNATTVTSNQATFTVQTPPLSLTLTASPSSGVSTVGTVVTYTYTLKNQTTSSMSNISVTDSRGASNISCVSSLAAGAQATCSHTYTVVQADLDSPTGYFSNTATASAKGNTNSNQAGVNVTVTQNTVLALVKTASPTTPAPATTFTLPKSITYSYKLTNNGNVTLSSPFAVTDSNFTGVTCPTGTVAPGQFVTCTKVYALTAADLAAGSITNTATGSATFGTKIVNSGTSSAQVITYTPARLALVKTPAPPYFTGLGSKVTYTFGLRNTGGEPLTVSQGYTITDTYPAGTYACAPTGNVSLPIGTTIPCGSVAYSASAADVTKGTITNQVTGSGTVTGVTSNPTASPLTVTIPLFTCSAQTIQHSGPTPLTPPSVSTVNWTITNNTGAAVTINSITISWNNSNGAVAMTQVALGGNTIWGPGSNTSGSMPPPAFTIGPNWTLNTGTTTLTVNFSTLASGIHITMAFADPACAGLVLDSNN